MGFPLYVINCFSLAAFKILSLSLSCVILIIIFLHVDLFEFTLFGTLYAFCTWLSFLLQVRECFSAIISSNKFPIPFVLFSLWYFCNANIKSLILSPDSYTLLHVTKSSRSLIYSSLSSNLLLTPSNLVFKKFFSLLYSILLDSFFLFSESLLKFSLFSPFSFQIL